jgi:hypothetical protein
MGLDLVVEGCARPGHEREWRSLLERAFADEQLTDAETARFQEVSIPGYQRIGAPQVGSDNAANEWILEARQAKSPEEVAAVLKEFGGYHVVRLVKCDGVPAYSNGGLYDGADETSFRGAFLNDCTDVLSTDLLNEAWESKFPEEAIRYGKALLKAADLAEADGRTPKAPESKRSLLARLGITKPAKPPEPLPISEQVEIVRSAGRWYVFWGERGHPIRAWF